MKNIIGVDVAKHELVIYVNQTYFTIANDEKSLHKWFQAQSTFDLVAYEATGGYEKCLALYLATHQLPGRRLHANHVRSYAKALGILAKTDRIDAKVIAEFARVQNVVPQSTTWTEHRELLAFVQRREQLIALIKIERNRLDTLTCVQVRQDIEHHIKTLKKKLKTYEDKINAYVIRRPELKAQVALTQSIPGVGLITSVSVLAYCPELKTLSMKALCALSGLAPMNKDSGRKTGRRTIQGGRAQIRRVLYMAALSAITYHPELKAFYERLRHKGKGYKVAITAVMRKLLTMIQAVVIRGTPWQIQAPMLG